MLPGVVMSVLTYRLTATIWKKPEGHVVRCSELGVASAGGFLSVALVHLKEVTEPYLENMMSTAVLIPIKRFLQVFS